MVLFVQVPRERRSRVATLEAQLAAAHAENKRLRESMVSASELGLFSSFVGTQPSAAQEAHANSSSRKRLSGEWGSMTKQEFLKAAAERRAAAEADAAAKQGRKRAREEKKEAAALVEEAKRTAKRQRVDKEAPLVAKLVELGFLADNADVVKVADLAKFSRYNRLQPALKGKRDAKVERLLQLLAAGPCDWAPCDPQA